MGCDYYIQTDLMVEFLDKNQNVYTICEDGEPQNMYIFSWPDYDSDDDIDTEDTKYYAELEKRIQENIYVKILFESGVWIKESYEKKYQRYLITKYCQIHKLIKVYKCAYAWKRT